MKAEPPPAQPELPGEKHTPPPEVEARTVPLAPSRPTTITALTTRNPQHVKTDTDNQKAVEVSGRRK